ncbi:MAG: methyl-accepting chemotaxis protein [Anaerolineae bacterium]|nr:methyl-accepting chemotaxis protein [Anaerolineae bacterium]MDW8171868.1 methyl-accepting chemotaxis protein [Anaerolineae bacterium]
MEGLIATMRRVSNRYFVFNVLIGTLPSLLGAAGLALSGALPLGAALALPTFAFVLSLMLAWLSSQRFHQPLVSLLEDYIATMRRVAEGDFRLRLPLRNEGLTQELGSLNQLGQAANAALERMQAVALDFTRALDRLEADTQAILEATARQIQMANEQDAVVTETTATVNEVRATVTETAERAQSVAETAQLSVSISKSGLEAVSETISGMDLIRRKVEDIADNILVLSEHTQQIGEIIAAVNALADQSRMLALNASVEAARAGEEGKGFAVVALEVRNLADQNRDATVQVREILGEIQRATNSAVMVTEEGSKGVDSGQTLVNKAGESINELARAIEDAALAAMQIAASTRQQTIGMDQLTNAMRTIKHATTETVSSTMMVEASVQRLREAAQRVKAALRGLVVE